MRMLIKSAVMVSLIMSVLGASPSFAAKGGKGTSTSCSVEPIIFIHGYSGNGSHWDTMVSRLLSDGVVPSCAIYRFEYNSMTASNKTSAQLLSGYVDNALAETGQPKARLVVHSNGGLVARWYRVFEGGSTKTSRLITLGSPHEGTSWGYGCYSPACFEFRPNSSFLQDLNGNGCDVSIWSDSDGIILPATSAMCADSLQTVSVGHMELLTNLDVYSDVVSRL